MATLSFQQLEDLWTKNGGNPQLAPTMAAIALAESGGHTDSVNNNAGTGDYSIGLWQINYYQGVGPGCRGITPCPERVQKYGTPQALIADPNAQARAAVDLAGNGSGLRNWSTWSNGAYSRYLNGNAVLSNGGANGTPTAILTAAKGQAPAAEPCLLGFPGLKTPAFLPDIPGGCFLGAGAGRFLLGAALVVPAVGLTVAGLILVAKSASGASGAIGAAVGTAAGVGGAPLRAANAIGNATGRDRNRNRSPRLTSQDTEDLDLELQSKRPRSEDELEGERTFRRESRARRRAQEPR